MASLGKLAISTEISSTMVQRRHAVLEAFDVEAAGLGIEEGQHVQRARLQAVSSRNMYSEQLWTVRPLAMKEWCRGSVRSKTCCAAERG